MRNGIGGIYFHRYPRIREKSGWRILIDSLALIQNDLYFDPSLVGIQQGIGNRCRGLNPANRLEEIRIYWGLSKVGDFTYKE